MADWNHESRLIACLHDPAAAAQRFSMSDWQQLLREARRCNLFGRVALLLEDDALQQYIPPRMRSYLASALRLWRSNQRSTRWEVVQLQRCLGQARIPFVLLKGAAYQLCDSDAARGRVFGDIDILVKSAVLQDVEKHLTASGWESTKLDPYDQKYYRQYMHELPPMRHSRRASNLDVHHAILPPTARLDVAMDRVWDEVGELPDLPGLFVPSPKDLIIHSATHLFHEGELHNGLRDLVDVDRLCREQASVERDFWSALLSRGEQLGLSQPLLFVLHLAKDILGTPVPESVPLEVSIGGVGNKGRTSRLVADAFNRALAPATLDSSIARAELSNLILYVRAHYLRMPLRLLLPHLTRKAFKGDPELPRPENR